MRKIQVKELGKYVDTLTDGINFPVISIYLKTHEIWEQNEKAKIELKNIKDTIQKKLKENDVNASLANDFVKKIENIEQDSGFWKNTKKGLAIFMSKNFSLAVILPKTVTSTFYISDNFNIKYLAHYLFENEEYYILAISNKKTYLYKAENRHYKLMPETEMLPPSMEDSMWMKEGEKSVQHHSTRPVAGSGDDAHAFHGHGAYKEGRDLYMKRYLRDLDNWINKALIDYETPLILVCTDTVWSVYKEISKYPTLLDQYVSGNPDSKEQRQKLLKKCWPIVKELLQKQKKEKVKDYKNSKDLSTSELKEVVRSSHYGQVGTLIVSNLLDYWGKYNKSTGLIRVDKRKRKDSEDLLNMAVLNTVKNSGKVYLLKNKKFGFKDNFGAVLRY